MLDPINITILQISWLYIQISEYFTTHLLYLCRAKGVAFRWVTKALNNFFLGNL